MKAIKALKRLTKAEALLSNVIERYVASGHLVIHGVARDRAEGIAEGRF